MAKETLLAAFGRTSNRCAFLRLQRLYSGFIHILGRDAIHYVSTYLNTKKRHPALDAGSPTYDIRVCGLYRNYLGALRKGVDGECGVCAVIVILSNGRKMFRPYNRKWNGVGMIDAGLVVFRILHSLAPNP